MASAFRRCACALGAVGVVATACQTNEILLNELTGAVITVVDSGPALYSARTFALPDTIIEVPRPGGTLGHENDYVIVQAVRRHFLAFGWREVSIDRATRPDVVVLIAAGTRIETGVAYGGWYDAWGYLPYWGGVDGSWAWGAPVGAIPYAFQAGTVFITMLDRRTQHEDTKTIPLLWAAAIDGLVTDPTNTAERALLGIDQAFAQSNYLRVR